jgi:hypothetical protein
LFNALFPETSGYKALVSQYFCISLCILLIVYVPILFFQDVPGCLLAIPGLYNCHGAVIVETAGKAFDGDIRPASHMRQYAPGSHGGTFSSETVPDGDRQMSAEISRERIFLFLGVFQVVLKPRRIGMAGQMFSGGNA